MNISDHLRAAEKNYQLPANGDNVKPISATDVEIIAVLIDIAEELGIGDLQKVLEGWKKEPDPVTLDGLYNFLETIDPEDRPQEGDYQKKGNRGRDNQIKFVQIGDRILKVFMLLSLKRAEQWSVDKGRYQPGILINEGPLPSSAAWMEDTFIAFPNEEARDKEWNSLQERMKETNCVFI